MRFLVDAQLPPGLAERLRREAHDALHVADILSAEATDAEFLAEAIRRNAVIVSKDQDFVDTVKRGKAPAGVLWIRIGNATNRVLWAKLSPLLPDIVDAFESGEALVEVG